MLSKKMSHILRRKKTMFTNMKLFKAFFLAVLLMSVFGFSWMVSHLYRLPVGINTLFEVHQLSDKLGLYDHSVLSFSSYTDERTELLRQINDYEENPRTNLPVDRYLGSNSSVKVFRFTEGKWKHDQQACTLDSKPVMRVVTLKSVSGKSTPVAIHYPKNDVYISGNLALRGSWEWNLVNKVVSILRQHPNAHFIDIGSNIGEYTLNVALEGRNVIAVEPLQINNVRLCISLMAGKLAEKVTIISNALSDQRSSRLTMGKVRGNIGASWLVMNSTRVHEIHSEKVDAACLDDILTLPTVHITEAVIKLDVETHEFNVLLGAETFFANVKVWAVSMEWQAHRHLPTGAGIINFFREKGFVAIHPFNPDIILADMDYSQWPSDVLWKRRR